MARPTAADKLVIAARRERVAALYLAGKLQSEIAAAESIDQGTVSRDLAAVREEWKARAAEAFEERLGEELAKIDHLERVALAAWERSCRDAESRHVRTETDGTVDAKGRPVPGKTISEKTTKGQAGDPRFLERVSWCVEQRLKVLGGYAPTKVAPTTPDGSAPYDPGTGGDDTRKLLAGLLPVLAAHRAGGLPGQPPAVGAAGAEGAGGDQPDQLGPVPGPAESGV